MILFNRPFFISIRLHWLLHISWITAEAGELLVVSKLFLLATNQKRSTLGCQFPGTHCRQACEDFPSALEGSGEELPGTRSMQEQETSIPVHLTVVWWEFSFDALKYPSVRSSGYAKSSWLCPTSFVVFWVIYTWCRTLLACMEKKGGQLYEESWGNIFNSEDNTRTMGTPNAENGAKEAMDHGIKNRCKTGNLLFQW